MPTRKSANAPYPCFKDPQIRALVMCGHVCLLRIDLPTPNVHCSTTILRHVILDTMQAPRFQSIFWWAGSLGTDEATFELLLILQLLPLIYCMGL